MKNIQREQISFKNRRRYLEWSSLVFIVFFNFTDISKNILIISSTNKKKCSVEFFTFARLALCNNVLYFFGSDPIM